MMPAGDIERYGELADGDWILGLSAPLAMIIDDGAGPHFARVSAGFLQAMEWTRAETAERPLEQLFPSDALLILTNAFHRVREGRGPVGVTAPIRRSNRRTRPVAFALHAAPGGALLEVVSPAEHRDGAVGWRRVLFQHLNFMGSGAARIYDRGPSGAADLAALLGFPEDRAPSEAELIHPDDAPQLEAHGQRLAAADEGYVDRVTVRMRHADGDWRWIEMREEVLNRTAHGALGQVLGFAIDVSEHHALLEATHRQSLAVMNAETEERKRIARELHDTMAQYLVVIDLALSRLQRTVDALPDEPVADIRQALRAAHEEVRSFSWLLHPPDIDRLGLARAVEKFAAGFGVRTGLKVAIETGDLPPLSFASELTLFRITQEALMNVHRHARATEVQVVLNPTAGDTVSLDVIDNGIGLKGRVLDPGSGEGVGVGLAGMKARVERLSGTMDVLPARAGFHLRVSLPVEPGPPAPPGEAGAVPADGD